MTPTYVFLKEDKDVAEFIIARHRLMNGANTSGSSQIWRRAFEAYYGEYNSSSPGLTRTGEQGEFWLLAANHLRNIVKNFISLISHNRIVFEPQAANTGVDAALQTKLARQVLDHYFYSEKKFSAETYAALEMACVTGFAAMEVSYEMDSVLVGANIDGELEYRGEPKFRMYSPFEVFADPRLRDWEDHKYVGLLRLESRAELQARYPESYDKLSKVTNLPHTNIAHGGILDDDDLIPLFTVYHKSTKALPGGRILKFCDPDCILESGDNPYEVLPVVIMRPDVRHNSLYGHAPTFDLLGPQEALNILNSHIISNQAALGVQNIVIPDGTDFDDTKLSQGLRVIRYPVIPEAPGAGIPQTLQMLAPNTELLNGARHQEDAMEKTSSISPTIRGSLLSGTPAAALAITATAAVTYATPTEQAYISFVSSAATLLLNIIQKFMPYEQVIDFVGPESQWNVQNFKGDSIPLIRRIQINVGSAYTKTYAGRVDVANTLLERGILKNAKDYLHVLSTGEVENILDPASKELNYIELENQQMLQQQVPAVFATENHVMHIQGHASLFSDPTVRNNPDLISIISQHIIEHQNQMEIMQVENPVMWAIITGQPIPAPQPNPLTGVSSGAPSGEGAPAAQSGPISSQDGTTSAIANAATAGYDKAEEMMAGARKALGQQ